MATIRRFWLWVQLTCSATLVVVAWGLAAVLIVGYVVNPSALGRQSPGGSLVFPFQVGAVIALLLVGVGCFQLSRSAVRRLAHAAELAQADSPEQPLQHHREARHAATPSHPANPTPRRSNTSGMSLRAKLFLLASFLLAGAAVLVGMLGEWMGPEPGGPGGPVAILALATFGAALALGIAFAKRRKVGSSVQADEPADADMNGDGRPVLVFIWWPIMILSLGGAIFMAAVGALLGVSEGSGLPSGIVIAVGVLGFIGLPNIVDESVVQFRGRGVRGFWRAFRATPWGDGGPG